MKKAGNIFLATLLVLWTAYTGLWICSAWWFQKEVRSLYTRAIDSGVTLLGPEPVLTNFPFVPEIYYSGGFQAGNAIFRFPALRVRGYPIPFSTLSFSLPEGISLDGIADPAVWSLDTLSADIAIPYRLPKTVDEQELLTWQKNGGKIDVRHYSFTKQSLLSEGSGILTLDEKLQPVFTMETVLRDYELFIREQKDKGLIDPFAAAVGTTMLNGFAKVDPATEKKTVTLNVSVRNRMLSVGPLQVLPLPEIAWDRHRTPVRPR